MTGYIIFMLINMFTLYIIITSMYKYVKYLLLLFVLIIIYLHYSYIEEGSPKQATLKFITCSDTVIYDSDNIKRVKMIKFSSDLNLEIYSAIFYGRTSVSRIDYITNHLFVIDDIDYSFDTQENKYIYKVCLDYSILPDDIQTDVVCHIEFPPVMEPNAGTYEMVIPYKYLLKDKKAK